MVDITTSSARSAGYLDIFVAGRDDEAENRGIGGGRDDEAQVRGIFVAGETMRHKVGGR